MPRIFPVYLFTGDDEYIKKEAVRKIKKALLGKDGSEAFNFNAYDIAGCAVSEVVDALRSASFISEKRVALINNIDAADKDARQAILKYAKNPSEDSCLILKSSKKEFSGTFYKDLAKCARVVSFSLPKSGRVAGWIQKEFKARGKSIRQDATLLLKELKEGDIESLRCEIDKLVTYVGSRPAVSRDDVISLVGDSASRTAFELVDALGRKDAKGALSVIKNILKTEKAIPKILGMIGWQLRRIKKAQDYIENGISSESASIKCRVTPFYMERFMKEIKSFRPEEIDSNINDLLKADHSIKTGRLKPRDALEALVVGICTKGR